MLGGSWHPPGIFVVSGPMTIKFCTLIDHQSVSSNKKKMLDLRNGLTLILTSYEICSKTCMCVLERR